MLMETKGAVRLSQSKDIQIVAGFDNANIPFFYVLSMIKRITRLASSRHS